jgi:hypothetical protein
MNKNLYGIKGIINVVPMRKMLPAADMKNAFGLVAARQKLQFLFDVPVTS